MQKENLPKSDAELMPDDRPFTSEIPKFQKLVEKLGLTGLANTTKWNELLEFMRNEKGWTPDYRVKTIDSERVSRWDKEWIHHLPFPFISMSWMDLRFVEKIQKGNLLDPEVIDHCDDICQVLDSIGFEYEVGEESIRVYGYSPKDRTEFNKKNEHNQKIDTVFK